VEDDRRQCTRQNRIDRHGDPSDIYYGGCRFSRNQAAHRLGIAVFAMAYRMGKI
jgi:hypothetical protein